MVVHFWLHGAGRPPGAARGQARGFRARCGRGFSLIEALAASVVLAMVVLAVGSAVSAGRSTSIEGQKIVLASMAADDLMSELSAQPYDDLLSYDGLEQTVGAMRTLDDEPYPPEYRELGRVVTVRVRLLTQTDLGVIVRGRDVIVTVFDDIRTLAEVSAFFPEPAP